VNNNRLEIIFKSITVIGGIVVIILNFFAVFSISTGMALLSIMLAIFTGLTIGSRLKD
jgi:hypothetical protein